MGFYFCFAQKAEPPFGEKKAGEKDKIIGVLSSAFTGVCWVGPTYYSYVLKVILFLCKGVGMCIKYCFPGLDRAYVYRLDRLHTHTDTS